MLTKKQLAAMTELYKNHGQTFTFSLDEAREFCSKSDLTDKEASIVHDVRAGKFYIENDTAPFIRNFETQYSIKPKKNETKRTA